MTENKIIEILMKEATSELTSQDRGILSDFTLQSAENKAFVEGNRLVLGGLPTYEEDLSLFDVDMALTRVKAKMESSPKVLDIKTAAKTKTKTKIYHIQKWAAAAVLLIGLSVVSYLFFSGSLSETKSFVALDGPETIQLVDGSEVVLNENATLTLSKGYGTNLRHMQLEGEAYFKVKNINDQPFIVKVDNIEVEVLGTEFNVKKEKDDQNINVFVAEGKVKVSNLKNRSKVLLTAGESSRFNKGTNALLKDKIGRANATSWMSDRLSFNEMPLAQVIEEIENHFEITILLKNKSLSDCKYTSLFNAAKPEEVLETLSAVFDMQIMREGENTFQLTGGSCN